MAFSKIILNGVTQIDLTQDTVAAENLIAPNTAHGADGQSIVGTASEGLDAPKFTVVWNNYWSEIISITCDKTYTECVNYWDNGTIYAMVLETDQGQSEAHQYVLSFLGLSDTPSPHIAYALWSETYVYYDIFYYSDGTIEFNNPSIVPETVTATQNGTVYPSYGHILESVIVNVPSTEPNLQSKSVSYTPTETAQSATVAADSGYDGLSSVSVSVGAISNTYVGSNITRRSSTDLTASGATVTAPAGYYANNATKTIANGSVTAPSSISGTSATVSTGTNTLTLTKSVSVTPNVTTAGYISSGTAGNASISLTASVPTNPTPTVSEDTVTIPSGFYSSSTTKSVASGTAGTPAATKGAVSNHTISVTPTVTNTTGYITGDTKTGTAVTVSASELVSGSQTVTTNDTYDVTDLAELIVNVAGGGGVTITDEPNATGITCVITSGGSPTPPTPETWETVFNGTAYANADQPYNYFWIADMGSVYPTIGSVWRVTIDGTSYRCTAYVLTSLSQIAIGNPKYSGETDDGNPIPANFYNAGWGAMVGDTELVSGVQHAIKLERLVED